MRIRGKLFAGSLATVAALSACSVEAPVTVARSASGLADVVGTATVKLCKFGPAGTTATFALTATGGTLLLGNQVTVNAHKEPVDCVDVWAATQAGVTVTVTAKEIAASPGTVLDRVTAYGGLDGDTDFPVSGKTATIRVNELTGGYLAFKNIEGEEPPPPPPPPPASEGCTPGYWKQKHHFDSWPAAYSPDMQFSAVFANAFPGKTLLQVLSAGGGGLTALGRHTVAALLNSGALDEAGHTSADVIAMFNAAYASGQYETLKNLFEGRNELGCPLN